MTRLELGPETWRLYCWNIPHRLKNQKRRWHRTPVLLPGKSHGWRSLVGCCPWDLQESDTIERLHFHFSLSRIGEGNGDPLQCSCLENPRDGGAWWAAVYGVAQSWTRLKQLISSSSSSLNSSIFRNSFKSGWAVESLPKLYIIQNKCCHFRFPTFDPQLLNES